MTYNLLIDIPVARAIVAHHGRQRGLEIIAGLADKTDQDAHHAAFQALGSKIERTDAEFGPVTIESVFALHEVQDPKTGETDHARTMFWDNGGVVMLGRTIPATTAVALEGRAIDHIVSHDCLAGLVATSIDVTPSGDGEPQLVVDIDVHTCRLADVAQHIRES